MPRVKDLTGTRLGKLVVLGPTTNEPKIGATRKRWFVRCDCGAEKDVSGHALIGKRIKSCGCAKVEATIARNIANTKHGHAVGKNRRQSREYATWAQMKERCLNPKHHASDDYAGRGIFICDRWLVFENFLEDMGPRPLGTSIDRIDNEDGYYKENCRWATVKQQNGNRRSNVNITIDGETKIVSEWARISGRKQGVIMQRIKSGWSTKDAVFAPPYAAHKKMVPRVKRIGKPIIASPGNCDCE